MQLLFIFKGFHNLVLNISYSELGREDEYSQDVMGESDFVPYRGLALRKDLLGFTEPVKSTGLQYVMGEGNSSNPKSG